jgi:hypothetical protein
VPASAYFLWVVHRLYRQSVIDWNRRPIVGAPRQAPRAAPWARRGEPLEELVSIPAAPARV